MKTERSENEVLQELEALASSPGYLHAVAYFCFRDNFVSYAEDATPEEFAKLYSTTRLIRTEISTLIGLSLKHPIHWELPDSATLQIYIEKSEALLEELHETLNAPMYEIIKKTAMGQRDTYSPFSEGAVLREAAFYGAESAYTFQYRELSSKKYGADNAWLLENKGFEIEEAKSAIEAAGRITTRKLLAVLQSFREKHPDEWTVLPAFELRPDEIASEAMLSEEKVAEVLKAFSIADRPNNQEFRHLNDFNAYNAQPLISREDGSYISFQHHALLEALYETPFFWMLSDKAYINTATENRGKYLETISHEFLVRVFGADRVFSNVLILDQRGERAGEIDTLVLFGSRAIIVQAKSKRMTIEARKGNDKVLKSDFAKSVQASYDQGLKCAELIGDTNYRLVVSGTEDELLLNQPLDKAYIFCLLSDHYPALSAQARELLKVSTSDRIPAPFVMDAFLLDAMTEMLRSPLHFLSYIDRRAGFNDKVFASHELTVLSYHLKLNLWIEDDFQLMQLGEDISTDLDLAMLVRREGLPGKDTPEGILTRLEGTTFARLIQQIDHDPRDNAVDLGIFLLGLSEDAARQLSSAIDLLSEKALLDGAPHDFTMGSGGEGMTVHITDFALSDAEPRLHRHCQLRKYQQHAKKWFGVLLSPKSASLRAIGKLDFKWNRDLAIEAQISAMPGTRRFTSRPKGKDGRKISWNAPCPCGSGKKFKKCCS